MTNSLECLKYLLYRFKTRNLSSALVVENLAVSANAVGKVIAITLIFDESTYCVRSLCVSPLTRPATHSETILNIPIGERCTDLDGILLETIDRVLRGPGRVINESRSSVQRTVQREEEELSLLPMGCSAFKDPSATHFLISLFFSVGILVSYVPQHVKIIVRKTSEGLSPDFLLLGALSSFAASMNIFLVSIPTRQCCSTLLSKFECVNALSNMFQIFIQAFGSILVLVLCVFATRHSIRESRTELQKLTVNFYVFLFYVIMNIALYWKLSANLQNGDMGVLYLFADISGIVALILSVAQYIPQLYTTWRIKHAGTLSIPMLCIQAPGGMIWATTLYLQPGAQWSSVVPFYGAAVLQATLLFMCLYYNHRYPTQILEANAELRIAEENIRNSRSNDEHSPLLQ